MSHRTAVGNRAPSSKFGRNKWKCDKYASEGRKQKNAARKAATIARNLAKAAGMISALSSN
jgi:hypothetical protein